MRPPGWRSPPIVNHTDSWKTRTSGMLHAKRIVVSRGTTETDVVLLRDFR
ncbi:unnamed protein product [marine sediment metagenome]|uniref:Uncharacterized protein n=1 Tax=marine sediment metagenome TaxID=412755 RepID=X0UHL3_9ZZZZ